MVRTLSYKGDMACVGGTPGVCGGGAELGWRRSLFSCLRRYSRWQASHDAFCCCIPSGHTLRHGARYLDDSARSSSRNQPTELISTKPRLKRHGWHKPPTRYRLSITYARYSRSATSTSSSPWVRLRPALSSAIVRRSLPPRRCLSLERTRDLSSMAH